MHTGKHLINWALILVVSFSLLPFAPARAQEAPPPEPPVFSASWPDAPHAGAVPAPAGEDQLAAFAPDIEAQTASSSPHSFQLKWRSYIMGEYLGARRIFSLDIDDDGNTELVISDSSNHVIVLRKSGLNQYSILRVSERISEGISRIFVADVDQDGVAEIFVGTNNAKIRVLRGTDLQEIHVINQTVVPYYMVVADTNSDGALEILIGNGTTTEAYDARTYQKLWSLSGYAGEFVVGNVDADADLEIVYSSGHVLNGATRALEWHYSSSGGFGIRVRIGDIDGDGINEIVGAAGQLKVTIFRADLKSPIWEISTLRNIDALSLADTDGDNRLEILYADNAVGAIHSYDGLTRAKRWQVDNTLSGITDIIVADTDQDSELELVYGAGQSSSGPDYLYVRDIQTRALEWKSQDLDGPVSAVALGDIDDDGEIEIVTGTYSSDSGTGDAVLSIIDASTHALEWQSVGLHGITARQGIRSIRIGDVDGDGETEFVVATSNGVNGLIQVYNGRARALERQSAAYPGTVMSGIELGDVDGDGKVEIVAGQYHVSGTFTGLYLIVFDGATMVEKWKSIGLDSSYFGGIYDIHLADVDGDSRTEIIASVQNGKVYVFDGVTRLMDAMINTKAFAVTSADLDQDGVPSILVGRAEGKVEFYHGKTYQLEKSVPFGVGAINCLSLFDFNLDAVPEWLVCQSGAVSVYTTSDQALLWRSAEIGDKLGLYNQVPVANVHSESTAEILLGSQFGLYQFESRFSPVGHSTLTADPPSAQPGERLTYTLLVKNATASLLPAVQVHNPLPENLVFVSGSLTASSGSPVFAAGAVTWEGQLPPHGTATITYQANIHPDAPRTQVINTAQVSAGSFSHTIKLETTISLAVVYLPLIMKPCANYFDDFSDPTSGWWSGTTSWMEASYSFNGGYLITAKVGYIGAVAAPTCKRQHYTVEVEVNAFSPWADRGLVFGLNDDWSKYYIFGVDPNYREYFLAYYNENSSQRWTMIKNYTRSLAIRDYGYPNSLKVTRIGSQIMLYVNGKLLGTWDHSGVLGETRVGLFTAPYESNYYMDGGTLYNQFRITVLYPTTITASSETAGGLVTSAASEGKADLPYHEQPYERLR